MEAVLFEEEMKSKKGTDNRYGRHQVAHNAGEDLTDALEQAPHGADMLERLPMVGTLHED